nr:hypothetical protein [Tanacetum cinerariifolium]
MESICYRHQQVLKWQRNWNGQDLSVSCSNLLRWSDNNDDDSDDIDESDDERTESDSDEILDPSITNVDQTKHEEEDVDERVQTPSDYELTNDEKIHNEENTNEEEEDEVTKELYDDVNLNLGNEDIEMINAQDAHVTLTPVLDTQKTGGLTHSSSVSSDFTSKLLSLDNPSLVDNEIACLMDTTSRHATAIPEITSKTTSLLLALPNFAFIFKFNERVFNLEKDLSEIKQVDMYAQALSSIPAIVDHYMDNKLGEAISKAIQAHNFDCQEEAQAKKRWSDNNDDDSDDIDESDDERTESDSDEILDPSITNVDQTKHEEEDVDERVQTPSDYELTNDEKIHNEENTNEEEEDEVTKELYDDVNLNLGNEDIEMINAQDAHVTLTPVLDTQKTRGLTHSSSVSSDFTSKLLSLDNPSLVDNEIACLMDTTSRHATAIPEITSSFTTTTPPPPLFFNPLSQQATPTLTSTASETTSLLLALPNFAFIFKFNERVFNLEKDLSEIKQVDMYAQALSSIPAIVDHYMDNKLGEAISKAIQAH